MLNDLDIIVKKYPQNWDKLRVYAIGDTHVGSAQFDEKILRKKLEIIHDDPQGILVLCGDLGDYGLKNSKTNVYQATMQPKEQQEYIYELFLPVADKIASCVPGNHEFRIVRETSIDPMLTLCCRWGCEDVYRENVAITKYIFGHKQNNRPNVFIGITTHGSTRNKHKKFVACFDGVDFAVSGHTHTPEYSPHGKIRINSITEKATHVAYKEIVVDANIAPGGYGIKHEYEIPPPPELQYLELYTVRENDRNRTEHKVMNYHTIQL